VLWEPYLVDSKGGGLFVFGVLRNSPILGVPRATATPGAPLHMSTLPGPLTN
jgi:hypothetical protein